MAIELIYGQTLGDDLLGYDDNVFVSENAHVTAGLTSEGIRWAFTEGPYGEWYPLDPLSHMLDCQLFGLDAWGHHLTNVLLHAAASILLFLVWRRMTGEFWPSAFVAAVFAVHPQHVESVAWVSERRDVLSGLFFMLTLGAYLGYVRHGRSLGRYALVAILLTLGLMSKPMLVTLPALLLLLDFWPLAQVGAASDAPAWTKQLQRPGASRLVLEKLPLFVLAAADCLMTLRTHSVETAFLSWPARIGNAVISCVTYIDQLFVPVGLAIFYPNPVGELPFWKVACAFAILIAISTAAVIWRRRFPYGFVGWFWYLGMLFPVLGLVTVSDHAMADRYMYLPGIGLSIALAWGAARLVSGSPAGQRVLCGVAGLLIVVLTACSVRQASFWRDDETLWRHALACTPSNAKAEYSLANALVQHGQPDEAILHFRQAQQYAVDAGPFNNLGLVLVQQGKIDESIAEFRRAVEIQPGSFPAHSNLGAALALQDRFEESAAHFRRALEIEPKAVNVYIALGHLLILHKKLDEAIPNFEAALVIDPDSFLAHLNLARALAARGQIAEALDHFRHALEIDPRNAEARAEFEELQHPVSNPGDPSPR